MIPSLSAITLATHDMARAVRFYRALGFENHVTDPDGHELSFARPLQ